jgi:hypothetical protein
MSRLIPAKTHSSGGVLVYKLVISSGGFLVYEVVTPGRITIYSVEGVCWQFLRMVTLPEFFTLKNI